MAISNLLSYLGFCHFPPHLSKKSDYWIFFIFIFNFNISSVLLKDCINPFLSKLRWQISSTHFCFCFVFLLSYSSFLLFLCFSLVACFQPFDFLLFFWTILMRNNFYYVTYLIRYIGVISIPHFILDAQPRIFESKIGFCKLEYKFLAIIWHKIAWK